MTGRGLGRTGMALRGVRKNFGTLDIIHGVDLDVYEGEFVVFVGPSGCGKSTLLRMIAGLEEVTDGAIEIGGRDVTDMDPSERGVAMVFQSYALYPHMSVRDNLGFGLRMARTPKAEIDEQVLRAAHILQIEPLLDRRPGQLSGGQRQRVAIGRAIVRHPKVFLFDEPLSNLDAELRVSMRIELARLHRELGNTMVYVTHDQTEAMTLADRIVVLRNGRIEQVGTPRELYEDPHNTFVAGFIGSPRMNLIDAVWRGNGRASANDTEIRLAVSGNSLDIGGPFQIGIRPEHLRLADDTPSALAAAVEFSEYLGGTRYIHCRIKNGQILVAEQREGLDLVPGEVVRLSWEPAKVLAFSQSGMRAA